MILHEENEEKEKLTGLAIGKILATQVKAEKITIRMTNEAIKTIFYIHYIVKKAIRTSVLFIF